jgi:putative ABC transport system permease protein
MIFDSRRGSFASRMQPGGAANGIGRDYRPSPSLAAGRVLAQILYQVSPSDPSALVASGTMLAAAALLACFFPARRATYVEPLQALRTE